MEFSLTEMGWMQEDGFGGDQDVGRHEIREVSGTQLDT